MSIYFILGCGIMGYRLTKKQIDVFREKLWAEGRERGTIEKYMRDVGAFSKWLSGHLITKKSLVTWKEYLVSQKYNPVTINSMLAAVNKFLETVGGQAYKVRYLRIQKRLFRKEERELNRIEYGKLLETAHSLGQERLALLMETICATGIRVSEVPFITVEAVRSGRADISLKGKIRTILLPKKLCRKLQKYAKKQKISFGEIFLTKRGKTLTRKQIWAEMKALCKRANVTPSKVFPHNLRHLFARTFYAACHDIAQLADVLGHSHIETTRIYLISTGVEHIKHLEQLGLVY